MPPYSPPPTKSSRNDLPSVISSSSDNNFSFAPRRPYPNQSSRGSNYDLPLSNQPQQQHPLDGSNPLGGEAGAGVGDSPASDFAYSTTLRRAPSFVLEHSHMHRHHDNESSVYGGSSHGGGEGGLVERLGESLAWVVGKVGLGGGAARGGDYERVGEGDGGHGKERDETPSEVFARLSVEVSFDSSAGGLARARSFPPSPSLLPSRRSLSLRPSTTHFFQPFPTLLWVLTRPTCSLSTPPGNPLPSPSDLSLNRSPFLPPPSPSIPPRSQRIPGSGLRTHPPQVSQTDLREPVDLAAAGECGRQFGRWEQRRRDQYRGCCDDRSDG